MNDPAEPENPNEQWAAYEPTQQAMPNPYAAHPYPQNPYEPDPYQQAAPFPQAAPPPALYGGPAYPAYPGSPQSVFAAQGPAPATAQASSIGAMVVGGILLLSCYGTLAGIAPLVLGILGFTKANSVNRLWLGGQQQDAAAAADSSRKLAMWAWISLAIGIAVTVLAVVLLGVWAMNTDPTPSRGTGIYGT